MTPRQRPPRHDTVPPSQVELLAIFREHVAKLMREAGVPEDMIRDQVWGGGSNGGG